MHREDYTEIIAEAHQLARPIAPSETCSAGTVGSVIVSRSGALVILAPDRVVPLRELLPFR